MMPQDGPAWALRDHELLCVGMVELAPCPDSCRLRPGGGVKDRAGAPQA